ncbi:MAG: A/G-specific adenine glycosylase [Bdellovibrionales bacterium]
MKMFCGNSQWTVYYSRARNLHKAAQILVELDQFPTTFEQLIELPGFGPYTARAVSSIAFSQPVGVIDGNTIRFLSRFENHKFEWWKSQDRKSLQSHVDQWVKNVSPGDMNQALMELGATICIPVEPQCLLCPLQMACQARKCGTVDSLPIKKPKRQKELWSWEAHVIIQNKKIAIVKNTYSPFLKGQWFLPGKAQQLAVKPKSMDFKHNITHHEIFVTQKSKAPKILNSYAEVKWVPIENVKKNLPFSLVEKVYSVSFILLLAVSCSTNKVVDHNEYKPKDGYIPTTGLY